MTYWLDSQGYCHITPCSTSMCHAYCQTRQTLNQLSDRSTWAVVISNVFNSIASRTPTRVKPHESLNVTTCQVQFTIMLRIPCEDQNFMSHCWTASAYLLLKLDRHVLHLGSTMTNSPLVVIDLSNRSSINNLKTGTKTPCNALL